jgi:hypothetical protein
VRASASSELGGPPNPTRDEPIGSSFLKINDSRAWSIIAIMFAMMLVNGVTMET